MFRKPLAFWLASDASEDAACFAWLPACCATSAIFEAASPALARISWDPPTPADETLDGVEDDEVEEGAELPERGCWLFIGCLHYSLQPCALLICSALPPRRRRNRAG